MRIVAVRERTVPLAADMRNAYIDFGAMTASVVAVVTDAVVDGRPVVGYGFSSNGRYAAGGLLRERFIPRLLGAEGTLDASGNLDPGRIGAALMRGEKPGGHGERSTAVAVLDMAVWDAVAKVERKPLYALLAERHGVTPDARVGVYAAGGYYAPGKDTRALQEEMRGYVAQGYASVKMKIGGAPLEEDLRRVEAVLDVVGEGSALAVDANGRFDAETALRYADALAPYRLRWYEEPGDPLDYALNAEVARHYEPPLATGENLFSLQDARNLIRYGGMRPDRDVLQFDPALAYGLTEYLRILEMLDEHGWSRRRCVPHGGHLFALHIAAGLGLGGTESYPGVFAPFGGFADGVPVEEGYVRPPDAPGVGHETKAGLHRLLRDLVA
ncbi:MAG TPA: mandelate racemase/muconate lactonizing enzyme family protein [Candidatus Limnocylindria bacterium]|nr:mandelate racemase/muconate lactonizing enzyme family protein [Candidatus Limnocylindria bacterium]